MLDRIASLITSVVGTMWCAIAFTILAVVSLPAALISGDPIIIVGWVAQTFLQLVLLPIIMVGQNQSQASTEQLIRETHDAVCQRVDTVHSKVNAVHVHVTGQQSGSKDELAKSVTSAIKDAVRRGQLPKNVIGGL